MTRFGLAILLAGLCDSEARAQAASSPSAEDIIVTAEPGDQQLIDRHIYSIKNNAQAQVETSLDVLRRTPSVTVTVQDQIQLLGNADVKILIDGHQIGDGSNALRALPAAQIAKIEVVTNPSAAFSAEGTAGIINIVTRRDAPLGLAGAASIGGDNFGGSIAKLAPSFANGRWSGSLSLELENDNGHYGAAQIRTGMDPDTSFALQKYNVYRESDFTGHAELAYTLRARESLTLRVDHDDSASRSRTTQDTISGAGDLIPVAERRASISPGHDDTASLAYAWAGKRQGESLALSATYSDIVSGEMETTADDFGGPSQILDRRHGTTNESGEFKLDYVHPFSRAATLSLGGVLMRRHETQLDGLAVSGDHTTSLPFGPDALGATWTSAAAYATLQFPLGGWKLLPGLRIEDRKIDAVGLGAPGRNDDVRWFPSMHAQRGLTKRLDLSLSYSRRIKWPELSALDPAIRYFNPLNGESGNPVLRPQTTDAVEFALAYRPGKQSLSFQLYDRETAHAWQTTARLLPNGVSLTSLANVGSLRLTGGEVSLHGPLWKGWHYDVSADFAARRAGLFQEGATLADRELSYSGNAHIEYQDRPDGKPGADHLQMAVEYMGPTQSFQARASGWVTGNFTWTHSFTPRLSSVLKANNLFAGDGMSSRIVAADYTQLSRRLDDGRRVIASLVCRLGKVR